MARILASFVSRAKQSVTLRALYYLLLLLAVLLCYDGETPFIYEAF